MSDDEPTIDDRWVRNLRGFRQVPGLWHKVKRQEDLIFTGSVATYCGFSADRQRSIAWSVEPPEGKACPKCLRALRNSQDSGS